MVKKCGAQKNSSPSQRRDKWEGLMCQRASRGDALWLCERDTCSFTFCSAGSD